MLIVCGQDTSRGIARRFAGKVADQVRTGHQCQDRQGARPRRIPDAARPRRRGDRMKRREFIAGLGVTVALPLAARAQQTKTAPRIGMLTPGTPERFASLDAAFLQGLRELGYTEGQNFTVERRFGDWKLDRLPGLAAELVRLNV